MQHLAGDLPELTGCVLACDCEMHMVCEGDALAGLVFESGRPPARTKKKRQAGASGQVRRVLAAVAALPLRWALPSTEAAGPYCGRPAGRGAVWEGACPPLLPFGLSCEQHFEHSLARADKPLPTEQPPLINLDLQFAADSMAGNYGSLRDLRGAVRALRELKSGWARVSTRLRHLQPDAIRTGTQQRDLDLGPSRGAVVLGRCGHPMAFSRSNRPCPSHWRMSSLTVRRTTQRSELPLSLACVTISSSASLLLMRRPGFVPRRLLGASF